MSNIACWMSEKKIQKINWVEFEKTCKQYGFGLFKLDLNTSLESQGTFCVFLHKLTDIIASADQGDPKCASLIHRVEEYIKAHPSLVVLDPISNVRQLLNRYISYRKINSTNLHKFGIFIPNFCELNSNNLQELSNQLKNSKVTYPFICKPSLGHGSKEAHSMSLIFNEKGLHDCKTPCVAQSFINHNAVLYKIFIVGDKHHFVERPSLKNFHACDDETIHFDSSDVSKAGSRNSLTLLEPYEIVDKVEPDPEVLKRIAVTLRDEFGMDLLGVDVVIENNTGRYAIIDINSYPGYDGFPDFYDALVNCINKKVNSKCKIDKFGDN
ncbi:inositol-tetrakisphosphate 1-kinase [Tribolium castaneum]|uniref:Inositol-tetrakisphosphate 1-kinase n=1 Tax=Tribolium castaneum TaxID=7070 RepID=D2A1U2_TRICA|nr:PREDICTED: inositol-tetrakisphosphate 1-kinase [Tribolium castaneum]EFA02124.1 Inositol-tetrakisphosphate 1-kinase-like Protein [Tribolium castaneum]|eukprot:XP_008191582.1 PREDICTED: inositol-tetrakisphosphate 1-kinase [Tribolium castaneum]